MKILTSSRFCTVIIYLFINANTLADEVQSIAVVNYFGNDGLLYSFNNMIKEGYTYRPAVRVMKQYNWGLKELITTSTTKKLSSIEGFKSVPINMKKYNELGIGKLTQVMTRFSELPRRTLEKLSKLGREQKVDFIYAIFPSKGHFIPPSDKRTQYVATPPGLAVLYGSSDVYVSVSVKHFLIDVKKRTVLSDRHFQDLRDVTFNARALKEKEIKAVLKWVNEDITNESKKLTKTDVDFSKPLTATDIRVIHSKVIEKLQEDISLLDQIMVEHLHHTMDEFEQLDEGNIANIKKTMHESAVVPLRDIENVLEDGFTSDEVD